MCYLSISTCVWICMRTCTSKKHGCADMAIYETWPSHWSAGNLKLGQRHAHPLSWQLQRKAWKHDRFMFYNLYRFIQVPLEHEYVFRSIFQYIACFSCHFVVIDRVSFGQTGPWSLKRHRFGTQRRSRWGLLVGWPWCSVALVVRW